MSKIWYTNTLITLITYENPDVLHINYFQKYWYVTYYLLTKTQNTKALYFTELISLNDCHWSEGHFTIRHRKK